MLGHQRPRLHCAPPKISSRGREAVELAAMAGLNLDPWQQWVLEEACAIKEETYYNDYTKQHHNMWAARDVGLVVARQNGKGSILEARELAGLFLFGERTIIHSAQDFATSGEHYRRLESLIRETPALHKEVKGYYQSNGKECIELKTGQRIVFKTRTKKLGRGFSPDLVVLDEAMFLDSPSMAALLPTLSARPNPQLWFTGSAGTKESTEFGRVRNRALAVINKGEEDSLTFAEWSADTCTDFCLGDCREHDSLDSEKVWAKSNPGLGIRLKSETIKNERKQLSEDMFKIERLSVGDWPVDGDAWAVIDQESWDAREDEDSDLQAGKGDLWTLAVDTSPDRAWTAITAAGRSAEDLIHVEITGYEQYDHRPGTDWVVPRVVEMWKNLKPSAVVIDSKAQASSFIAELEEAGVKILSPTTSEYAVACGEFHVGVVPRKGETPKIVHVGQQPLTNAVAGADKRDLAEKWAWDKKNSSADISPLVSVTLAAWGYRKLLHEAPAAVTPWVFRR